MWKLNYNLNKNKSIMKGGVRDQEKTRYKIF